MSYEGINSLLSLYDNYTCPFNKGLMSKNEMFMAAIVLPSCVTVRLLITPLPLTYPRAKGCAHSDYLQDN